MMGRRLAKGSLLSIYGAALLLLLHCLLNLDLVKRMADKQGVRVWGPS